MALRVLLADNSETIKKVIQLTLQDFQIDLRVVTLGVDVLDVALQFKPDIIFVDILLQKKSGYEVSKELKNNVNLKNIPVILMWSGFMEFDEPKAKESLADARLEKPFDPETLKNLVNKLTKKPAANDVANFLDFPTAPKAPTSPKAEKHEDPLKSLENIKRESEKFNPEKIKTPETPKPTSPEDYPLKEITKTNVQTEEHPAEEFEMQPLDKTTGFGYRPTNPPTVDHGSLQQQTKSFVLNIPDDAGGEDIPLEIEKIDNVEDMSFLLNPESVVGPNPLKNLEATKTQTKNPDHEPTKVTDPQTKIIPPKAQTPPTAPVPSTTATPSVPMPSAQDLERIVREEVREAIEKAVWQVVPELASQIIKKELDRLLSENGDEKSKS